MKNKYNYDEIYLKIIYMTIYIMKIKLINKDNPYKDVDSSKLTWEFINNVCWLKCSVARNGAKPMDMVISKNINNNRVVHSHTQKKGYMF